VGHLPEAVHIIGNVHRRQPAAQRATCTPWARRGRSRRHSHGRHDAMGGVAGGSPPHARPRRPVLHQNRGWASGGWISDSLIDGNTDSGSQQQWISRTAGGAAGPAQTGTWYLSAWCILRRARGQPRPTPPLPRHRSSAKSRSSTLTKRATGACAFHRCAPTAWASPGAAARLRGARSRCLISSSHMPEQTPRLRSMRSLSKGKIFSSRRASTNSPSPSE
jgi:hypothetical protein